MPTTLRLDLSDAALAKAADAITSIPEGRKGYVDLGITLHGVEAEVGHRFSDHWAAGAWAEKAWAGPWAAGGRIRGTW